MKDTRFRPAVSRAAVAWFAVAAAAGVLGYVVTPEAISPVPGARALPRLPGPPPDFPALLYQLGVGSFMWFAAIVTLPLLLLAARHVDAERLGRWRTLLLVAGSGAAFIGATMLLTYFWTYGSSRSAPPILAYAPVSLRQHGLPWIALFGIVAAIEARRRAVQGAIESERLRAEVAKQRLIALSGQLRPHFLFNTLQAISTLIHRDPEAADEMLTKFSDLLREVLTHRDSPIVRLEDEVRYARLWLEISKVRFADRLTFDIDVPPDLHDCEVPLFILQPLIENALTHGIGAVLRGGRVTIRARQVADRLKLEVSDDGPGLPAATQRREGIGLGNTRERLQATYGDQQSLTCDNRIEGGATIVIELPIHRAGRRTGPS